jgi:hypothetical protein
MSQEARTTAILLLALQNNLIPQPTIPNQSELAPTEGQDDGTPTRSKAYLYSQGFKAYLRKNIRIVLLDEDLECYGHRNAQRLQASVTPVTRVMVRTLSLNQFLPHLLTVPICLIFSGKDQPRNPTISADELAPKRRRNRSGTIHC